MEATVRFVGREATFEFRAAHPPVALRADPAFDVFRRLDPREIPASIGQIFGEPRIVAVLPSAAPASEQRAWRALATSWASASHRVEVMSDRDLSRLPDDRAAWILGRTNTLAPGLFLTDAAIALTGDELTLGSARVALAGHSVVITRRHPTASAKAIGWIVNAVPEAFDGLGRKLPHYGRYSYLAFEGAEPVNTIRGEWSPEDSPLTIDMRPPERRAMPLPRSPRRPWLIMCNGWRLPIAADAGWARPGFNRLPSTSRRGSKPPVWRRAAPTEPFSSLSRSSRAQASRESPPPTSSASSAARTRSGPIRRFS
jgi:hypothetical protein